MKYQVPFVDMPNAYGNIKEELQAVFDDVLSRGDLIQRQDLEDFETSIARFIGANYAIGVGSGTDALDLALRAAKIGPGDEVITVSFTCVATLSTIIDRGATPVLIDVGDDFNMNPDLIWDAITPKTKAIIPVHLNGRCCDMDPIIDIAGRNNLIIIEDAAQAVGARYKGQGAGNFGLIGCYSTYPMKLLGCTGDGGFITTNDIDITTTIHELRDLGQCRSPESVTRIGVNSRLDNLQAALLNVKLKYLPGYINTRRALSLLYHEGLYNLESRGVLRRPPMPDLTFPDIHRPKYKDVFQNYVIRVETRDALVQYLSNKGIETLTSWYFSYPIHYHMALGLSHFKLPKTEQFAKECIALPVVPELEPKQILYVIETIKEFFK